MRTRLSVCRRKRRYASEGEAAAAAAKADFALRLYRCDRCSQFHLTGRTKGKRQPGTPSRALRLWPDIHQHEDKMDLKRIALSTGVELDVAIAGDPANPPIILLHGFPESHRTWRHQIPELAKDHYVIAPDQRGYARSSKPEGVDNYSVDKIVADLLALADALEVRDFTLVGHDWGGAIAWSAALKHPDRIKRLVILNAPHPRVFQKSLYDDKAQRAASQYVNKFRNTTIDQGMTGSALEHFFASSFAQHVVGGVAGEEKAIYMDQWGQPGAMTAMLNWYRASGFDVPKPDEEVPRPAELDRPFPPVTQPTLVIWGMQDQALLPVQVDGLDPYVPNLTRVKIEDGGHFIPWEKPEAVNAALREWLAKNR